VSHGIEESFEFDGGPLVPSAWLGAVRTQLRPHPLFLRLSREREAAHRSWEEALPTRARVRVRLGRASRRVTRHQNEAREALARRLAPWAIGVDE
jgi:hypothetical protein